MRLAPIALTLAAFALALPVRAQSCPATPYPISGSMGCYPTYDEAVAILADMETQYPEYVRRVSLGFTHEGRDVWLVELSDHPGTDEGEPEALFTALHDARDAAGLPILLHYMWDLLARNAAGDPEAQHLLETRRLYFFPLMNPDGYAYNETTHPDGGGNWIKNRQPYFGTFGVNLNRNYGYQWGFDDRGSSGNAADFDYRGESPFSETETAGLRVFVNTRAITMALNYFAGTGIIQYPWGYTTTPPPDAATFERLGQRLADVASYDLRAWNYGASNSYYNGIADDWLYGATAEHERVFSFTNATGATGFTGLDTWPAPEEILPYADENIPANDLVAWLAGGAPEATAVAYSPVSGTNPHVDPGETFEVAVSLTNAGLRPTTATVSGVLASSPHVTFVGGAGGTVSLAPDEAQATPFTFTLRLAPDTPLGTLDGLVLDAVVDGTARPLPLTPLLVGTPVTLFSDDASSLDHWQGSGVTTEDVWGLSTTAFSPPTSFTDSPNGDYEYTKSHSITLLYPPLDLSGVSNATLRFWTRWDIERHDDAAFVLVGPDRAGQGDILAGRHTIPWHGNVIHAFSPPLPAGSPVYQGTQTEWVEEVMDLTPYAGDDEVFLSFYMNSGNGGFRHDGWYVDDIRVESLTNGFDGGELALRCAPEKEPVVVPASGGTYTYTLTLTNNGAAARSLDAWVAITGPAGQTVGPRALTLGPGASVTRALTQRVPAAAPAGTYTHACHAGAFDTPEASSSFTWTKSATARDATAAPVLAWSNSLADLPGQAPTASASAPVAPVLEAAVPNPLTSSATIRYRLPEAATVRLAVYDVLGRTVAVLADGPRDAGRHEARFDAAGLAPGVYVFRLDAGAFSATRRMTLTR